MSQLQERNPLLVRHKHCVLLVEILTRSFIRLQVELFLAVIVRSPSSPSHSLPAYHELLWAHAGRFGDRIDDVLALWGEWNE